MIGFSFPRLLNMQNPAGAIGYPEAGYTEGAAVMSPPPRSPIEDRATNRVASQMYCNETNMGTPAPPSNLTHLLTSSEIELLRGELQAAANQVVEVFLAARLSGGNSIVQETLVESDVHLDYHPGGKTTNHLLTVKEVADIFKLSVRKVWRLAAAGQLPPPLKIGRSSRWIAAEIEAYINTVRSNGKN